MNHFTIGFRVGKQCVKIRDVETSESELEDVSGHPLSVFYRVPNFNLNQKTNINRPLSRKRKSEKHGRRGTSSISEAIQFAPPEDPPKVPLKRKHHACRAFF